MKKLLLLFALVISTAIFKAEAQVRVNINIGSQPEWGPAGYDYVDYYYFPDMDVYYSVPDRRYIYPDNGRWVFVSSLPPRYQGYDVYNSYKVVINEPRPYLRADVYRARYARYRGKRDQEILRDHHDNGNHNGWYKNGKGERRDNDNHNGNGGRKEKHGRGRGHDD